MWVYPFNKKRPFTCGNCTKEATIVKMDGPESYDEPEPCYCRECLEKAIQMLKDAEP